VSAALKACTSAATIFPADSGIANVMIDKVARKSPVAIPTYGSRPDKIERKNAKY
jgi:hypothetical protein